MPLQSDMAGHPVTPPGFIEQVQRWIADDCGDRPVEAREQLLVVASVINEHLTRFAAHYQDKALKTRERLRHEPENLLHPDALLSFEDRVAKSNSRSFDSQAGNNYQYIIRGLVTARYGLRAPTMLLADGCERAQLPRGLQRKGADTLVYSNLDRQKVNALASELVDDVKAHRCGLVGSSDFQHAFNDKIRRLQAEPRAEDLWATQVDMVVLDEVSGATTFSEIKGGGQLDSAKLPAEIRKVLTPALAYGHFDTRIAFWPLAFKPKFFGSYFDLAAEPSPVQSGDGLLRIILPESVSSADFSVIMKHAIQSFSFKL